jgi:uncharacterized membrane protein YgcG
MTDDELLAKLAGAFAAPAPIEPPAAGLRELHRALDTRSAQPIPSQRPTWRLLPIALATAVAAACITVVLVIATLPRISRDTATQVTVTVTSPAFGEVTVQQRALARALTDGDVADVATSAARLRIALRDVTPTELAPIRAEIERLLARADAVLDRDRGGNEDLSPPASQPSTSAPRPAGTSIVPAAPTGTATQATSQAAPQPTVAAPVSPSTTLDDGDDDADNEDDNSNPGPGGGGVDADDDHSGPGGDDDNRGPGGDGDSGGSGGGSGSGESGGSSGSG